MRDGKAKRPSVCTLRVEFGPFVPAVPAHVSRTTTLPLARADTLRPSASACLDTDLAIRPIQLGWKYQKTGRRSRLRMRATACGAKRSFGEVMLDNCRVQTR